MNRFHFKIILAVVQMRSLRIMIVVGLMFALAGCGNGVELAQVHGKVNFKGEPLKFGGVMFQSASGQPSRATIQPDGTFEMGTFQPGDGATVGMNQVRITCYEAQRPGANVKPVAGETVFGKLYIPEKYVNYTTSGIEIDVKPGGLADLVIDLKAVP